MWFIGSGYTSEAEHLVKCIVQSVCIGSVNAFVLISGWFGIRSGLNKIGDLVFMLLFCTIPLLTVSIVLGLVSVSTLTSLKCIYEFILGGNNYWFVIDYIGLVIIAPILNNGIEGLAKKQFSRLLIYGYILIGIYDFILRSQVLGVEGGYSIIWFAYLYLLARYLRIYGIISVEKHKWLLLFLSVALQSLLFYYDLIGLRYTNPLIIIEAISLIGIFSKWNFHSKVINYASKATLMAYLVHMQPILIPYISSLLAHEYSDVGYFVYMLEVLVLSIVVFMASVPLNQLQSLIYYKIKSCWLR